MGYKDKYNKLVEAIKVLQETNPSDEGLQNWVNDNVPELKESEAERIRKWCISHFNGCISVIKENDEYKEFLSNKVVAWLEKQGETNPYSGVSFKYNGHTWGMCARDNGVEISCDKQFIKQLDEQGERPRYNIGDILCDLSCNEYDKDSKLKYEIIDIKNGMYICDNGSIPVSQQDEYKLVAKKAEQKPVKVNNDEDSVSNELREASFIFAARQMVHKASPEERKLELIYSFEEGAKWQAARKSASKVEPKFRVKYAGSEYNVLEVKDIAGVTYYGIEDEPNHIDYIKAENCERVDGYSIKENGSTYPTKPAVFSEQNPAWSEEDESWFKEIELMCLYFSKDTDYRAEFSTWLKSLKDRVKTQQEWTMQDEEELQIALDTLVKAGQHSSAKWLKNVCLVPQNKWKPSGVQMTVLDDVIINGHLSNANQKILKGLQEQLRKLK